MKQLLIFAVLLTAFAVFDLRRMIKGKLYRELTAYCALYVIVLTFGILYFPEPMRRSVIDVLSAVFNIGR